MSISSLKRRLEALERKTKAEREIVERNERVPDPILLTKSEVATTLGFGIRWLEMQIAAGAPCVRIGRSVRMRREDVEAFGRTGKWPRKTTQAKERT